MGRPALARRGSCGARRLGFLGLSIAGVCVFSAPARAVYVVDLQPNFADNTYDVLNILVGADTFYNNGYFGQRTVVANVEAGLVWDGHETTSQNGVTYFYDPTTFQTFPQTVDPVTGVVTPGVPEYDYHATAVGFTLAGLGPVTVDSSGNLVLLYYQLGIAPGATLWSAGVATSFVSGTGQFDVSAQTMRYAYQTVNTQTVFRVANNTLFISSGADVINSSFGFADPNGSSAYTALIDAINYTYRKTFVVAAGNTENAPPADPVTGPASGFNCISVGALDDPTPFVYNVVAAFSNRGPNDFYNPKTGVTIPGVRCGVDICAPGTNFVVPAYLGATGSNTGVTDPAIVSPAPYPTDLYYFGFSGTSFAAPTVAGGASLVADAGWANFNGGNSIDGRVIKAVLLNSADKIPGWSNNLALGNDPAHPNVLTTTQSLDYASGAGALNLTRAYTQYLGGTTDVPGVVINGVAAVQAIGWDFAQVTPAAPNDYLITSPLHKGDKLTATLDWFVQGTFTDDTPTDPALQNVGTYTAFFNLDLQVWEVDGSGADLIAQSISLYNNTEHLWFDVPSDGQYFVRVLWAGTIYDMPGNTPQVESYGLAWSDLPPEPVPEPGSLLMLGCGVWGLMRRSGRAAKRH
jgi:hypothetical protein